MNLGIVVISVTALGYVSNWLNWRFLNYKIVHLLYYIGAFIHETSHAIFCVLTGAEIREYKVFSRQPRVVYLKPRLPIIGNMLISFAPIVGGLLFLFLINKYFLASYFTVPQFTGLPEVFTEIRRLLAQINILRLDSWVMLLLFLNIGAMLGPSPQDLKNIWPLLIILFFVQSPFFINLGLLAVILIFINIAIQLVLITAVNIIKNIY